jgi:hypothetical protein
VAELRRRLGKSLFCITLLLAALKVIFWDIGIAAGEHISNAQLLVIFLCNAWIIGLFFAFVWLTVILAREQITTKTWLQGATHNK